MKQLLTCLVLSMAFLQNATSQDGLKPSSVQLPSYYRAKLNTMQGQMAKGRSITINDSSITMWLKNTNKHGATGPDPLHKAAYTGDTTHDKKYYTVNNFHYESIKSVQFRNQKLKGWTVVAGMVVGIVVGAVIGYNNGDDPNAWFAASAGEKAFFGGLVGAGLGAVTGLIVSSAFEKKYMINGEWKSLEEMKASLRH